MDKEYIRRCLPEEPPEGLLSWAKEELAGDLGGEYCVFHAERVPVMPTPEEIMEHNSMNSRRTQWAAVCTCSSCQEDFITQKVPGEDAIRLVTREDGQSYTLDSGEIVNPYMVNIETNREGDTFLCPCCGSELRLIHSKKVRGGRKKQVMVVSVGNVECYTGIFNWVVWRTIDEFGLSTYGVDPKDAFVLTERGGLVRYAHQIKTGWYGSTRQLKSWQTMTVNRDTIDETYSDWGSINNRKMGAALYEVYPDLGGTTGEKTGLIEYLRAGGYRPVVYLKEWRKHRSLENLCKCGQARLVADIIRESYRFSYQFALKAEKYIDLTKRKPHEILRITKGEFKLLRKQETLLTADIMQKWKRYFDTVPNATFAAYFDHRRYFGDRGLADALYLMRKWPGTNLDKLARYMEKQRVHPGEVQLLIDTRDMTQRLYGNRALTQEELWPGRLQEAHDRVAQMLTERENREKAQELAEGFQRIREWYGHLEWTDGELSVILPKSNAELVNEGKVLRHCVGGYGRGHVQNNSLIFFIRHYRRPERPYYTLNISVKGQPQEIQLHGYGNERHGPHKEYSHKIPAKVRAFCDRWENEILLPWYAEQQKKQKEVQTA